MSLSRSNGCFGAAPQQFLFNNDWRHVVVPPPCNSSVNYGASCQCWVLVGVFTFITTSPLTSTDNVEKLNERTFFLSILINAWGNHNSATVATMKRIRFYYRWSTRAHVNPSLDPLLAFTKKGRRNIASTPRNLQSIMPRTKCKFNLPMYVVFFKVLCVVRLRDSGAPSASSLREQCLGTAFSYVHRF